MPSHPFPQRVRNRSKTRIYECDVHLKTCSQRRICRIAFGDSCRKSDYKEQVGMHYTQSKQIMCPDCASTTWTTPPEGGWKHYSNQWSSQWPTTPDVFNNGVLIPNDEFVNGSQDLDDGPNDVEAKIDDNPNDDNQNDDNVLSELDVLKAKIDDMSSQLKTIGDDSAEQILALHAKIDMMQHQITQTLSIVERIEQRPPVPPIPGPQPPPGPRTPPGLPDPEPDVQQSQDTPSQDTQTREAIDDWQSCEILMPTM